MARRQISSGLQEFFDWLKTDREFLVTTARSYTSSVRAIVRELGDQVGDADAVGEFFRTLHDERPASYPNMKNAWRVFTEFAREQKGVVLPAAPRLAMEHHGIKPLPTEVRKALRVLKGTRMVPMRNVVHLTWAQVDMSTLETGNPTTIEVKFPWSPNVSALVPTEIIRTLHRYAVPRADGQTALVPCVPSGVEPYPQRALLREIRSYEEA